jgi:hypothetical protein
LYASALLSAATKIFVSSAKTTKCPRLDALEMSLIYIKKSKGPRTDPCGTPYLTNPKSDFSL